MADSKTDMLEYQVDLPEVPKRSDVSVQILQVLISGVEHTSTQYPPSQRVATFRVPQDCVFQLRLGYKDNSTYSSPSFGPPTDPIEARDTISPEAPGPFGEVRLIAEIPADRETPEPVVDESSDSTTEDVVADEVDTVDEDTDGSDSQEGVAEESPVPGQQDTSSSDDEGDSSQGESPIDDSPSPTQPPVQPGM